MQPDQTSKFFPESFYRVSIKALVVKDGKILLVKESEAMGGTWELPGGGLDFGEEPHDGLRREVLEEMNLKIKTIAENPTYIWTWRHENQREIDWFYSCVLAYRAEFENFNFKKTEECAEIGWFSKEELAAIDLNGKTNHLKKIFNPDDFKENF